MSASFESGTSGGYRSGTAASASSSGGGGGGKGGSLPPPPPRVELYQPSSSSSGGGHDTNTNNSRGGGGGDILNKLPNTVIIPDSQSLMHASFRGASNMNISSNGNSRGVGGDDTRSSSNSNNSSSYKKKNNTNTMPHHHHHHQQQQHHHAPREEEEDNEDIFVRNPDRHAPPPPGFGSGGGGTADDRHRPANDYLWGPATTTTNIPTTTGQNPSKDPGGGGGANAFAIAAMSGGINSERSNTSDGAMASFSNLAGFLGSGLMESMDDATGGGGGMFGGGREEPLNYHRMKRHTASRLVGHQQQPSHQSSPPPPSAYSKSSSNEEPYTQYNSNSNNASSSAPKEFDLNNDRSGIVNSSSLSTSRGPDGFPWTLSVPKNEDVLRAEKEQNARRNAAPAQIYLASPPQQPQQRRAPATADMGGNRSLTELERGMQNLWSPEAREFKPASVGGGSGGGGGGARSVNSVVSERTEVSSRQAESDLQQFLWRTDSHQTSRTLAILHVSWLRVPDIRSSCERFGVLESFRADFSSRGIVFVSYYDIRSAQYAAAEVQPVLQRLSVMQGSNEEVVVRYCLSLSSSSQFDESKIVISNLPHSVNEYSLKSTLSSYGALLSVSYKDDGSFQAEFLNLQDTKHALLELDSSQPWGQDTLVEVSVRNGMERKRGRELLALIGSWRHGTARVDHPHGGGGADTHQFHRGGGGGGPQEQDLDPWGRESSYQPQTHPGSVAQQQQQQPHYVLGPDGRYTQVVVQNHHQSSYDTPHQQVIHGSNRQVYIAAPQQNDSRSYNHHRSGASHHSGGSQYGERRMQHQGHSPYYSHSVASDGNSLSGRSMRSGHSQGTDGEKDNRHLMMDLDMVEIGHDTRTSLMVRNIPNKYTQQMLLSEFEANGHGPGIIDFFYLPIDFKNRCNRGYAFINFVDSLDILAFHRRYYGKHWRTFNSDKICDITYARIQGKEAMLKRFENSALMEKDEEYKPLVFASDGPTKGTRLPFPDPSLQNRIAHPHTEM